MKICKKTKEGLIKLFQRSKTSLALKLRVKQHCGRQIPKICRVRLTSYPVLYNTTYLATVERFFTSTLLFVTTGPKTRDNFDVLKFLLKPETMSVAVTMIVAVTTTQSRFPSGTVNCSPTTDASTQRMPLTGE